MKNIFGTPSGESFISNIQLTQLVSFIIENRDTIIVSQEESIRLLTTKNFANTPIGNIWARYIEQNKEPPFCLVKIPKNMDIPELLSVPFITLDTAQFTNTVLLRTISLYPEIRGKIILNITPFLNSRNEISDVTNFQEHLVRDTLVRSYFKSETTWLSPNISLSSARFYSMSLSEIPAQLYQINNIFEVSQIRIIYAFQYLSNTLNSRETAASYLRSNAGIFKGVTPTMVSEVIAHINSVSDDNEPLSFSDACISISKLGIPRLEAFSRRVFATRIGNIAPTVFAGSIMLDYPPYWIYAFLSALSGKKIGLTYTIGRLFKQTELNEYVATLRDNLARY